MNTHEQKGASGLRTRAVPCPPPLDTFARETRPLPPPTAKATLRTRTWQER